MKKINEKQKEFYEETGSASPSEENSVTTNLYRRFRGRIMKVLQKAGIKNEIDRCHRRWCPDDISDYKVLDLGAGSGTDFGIELATRSGRYIACDLSTRRLGLLEEKLEARGVQGYRLISTDFLDADFPEAEFDLVYARAVMHHFGDLRAFIKLLLSRMKPGGLLLTHDPMVTWTPYRLFRRLYEPFQSDSAWEHPFTRSSLRIIEDMLTVKHVQGLVGRSKWATPTAFLSQSLAASIAEVGHRYDLEHATGLDECLDCLQITMCLLKSD